MKVAIIFFISFLLSVSVAFTEQKKANDKQTVTSATAILKTTLRSLNLKNTESDLNTNVSNKDYRFIGVCGFVCYAPGVTDQDAGLVEKYGLRILEGTSDDIESNEHARLIEEATQYAQIYNEGLLNRFRKNEIP